MENNFPKWAELQAVLEPTDRLLCLIRPDPDSMASALALRTILRRRVETVVVAYDEAITRLENRAMVKLLRLAMVHADTVDISRFTKVALVDGQSSQFPDRENWSFQLVFDHHPIIHEYPYLFTDIRPGLGATSTLMEEYLRAARVRVSERLATALCFGIKTDTDNFQRGTRLADAEAFSRLFPRANFRLLQTIEQAEIPSRQLSFFDLALHRLRVKQRRAVVHLGAAESADIAVIIADFLIRVSGIEFVVVSIFLADKLVLIFRSRSLRRHAGRIAHNHFGEIGSAGGHPAAGRAEILLVDLPAEIKLFDPDSVERWIERELARPGKSRTAEAGS